MSSINVQINDLKEKLREAVVICEMEGLCEAMGHVSVRVPGSDTILMTPQGPPGATKLSDIVTLNLKGEKIRGGGKLNSEFPIHTSIYRVREDVQSVVHVHPPKVIAFSIAGQEIVPMRYGDGKFLPSVPIFGAPGEEVYITTDDLGNKMAKVLGKGNAVIIRGHGAVTVGSSIEAACLSAIALEKTAEIQFMASMLLLSRSLQKDLQPPRIRPPETTTTVTRIQKRHWDFYVGKLKQYLKK